MKILIADADRDLLISYKKLLELKNVNRNPTGFRRWVKVDKSVALCYTNNSRDGSARFYACGVSRLRGR